MNNLVIKSENWTESLKNDNVFINANIQSLESLTGLPCINGKSKALVSEGRIVNVVSDHYGFLDNANYFTEIERRLIDADINYVTRSENRDNCSFSVDYIMNDDRYFIDLKNTNDVVIPMLRFTNSYDGLTRTSGNFGFFRKVCNNGLHVAETKVGFRVKHNSTINEVVLPNISELVEKFLDNEYYTLKRKFEVLAETPVASIEEFVKYTLGVTGLFKFEKSEKNPTEPSAKAQMVIDIMKKESSLLGVEPSLWLGYNAFNEAIHTGKADFTTQGKVDNKMFNAILEMAN